MRSLTLMKALSRWLLVLGMASGPAFAQVVIFENRPGTSHPISNGVIQGAQGASASSFGDQITLGGADRLITYFAAEVQTVSAAAAFTADVSLRLYNAGPDNTVGTQIGATVVRNDVTVSELTLIEFTGLSILVPDTIVYQVAFENASVDSSYQWGVANTPSVGSSDTGFYYLGNGTPFSVGWEAYSPGIDGNPSVTIAAVPEPETFVYVIGLGLIAFGFLRR